MIEVTVHIQAPELATAVNTLAAAISGSRLQVETHPVSDPFPAVPAEVPTPASPTTPAPAVPVTATAVAAPPQSAAETVPTTVPTEVRAYTLEDLCHAAAPLMDTTDTGANKMAELQALLKKYGVVALTQLPAEHYAAFATDLRGMGAKI